MYMKNCRSYTGLHRKLFFRIFLVTTDNGFLNVLCFSQILHLDIVFALLNGEVIQIMTKTTHSYFDFSTVNDRKEIIAENIM